VTDRAVQRQAAIDEFLDLLRHERRGDTWLGRTPDWYGPVVFGGVGLALTISAACRDAPTGSRLHSLHAHFLRPVQGEDVRISNIGHWVAACGVRPVDGHRSFERALDIRDVEVPVAEPVSMGQGLEHLQRVPRTIGRNLLRRSDLCAEQLVE
jgi:hypothetical protein